MKTTNQSTVTLLDYMGDDISVVNAARVSFHKESDYKVIDGELNVSQKDQKLIEYLAKHNHWSPFAHTSIQIRVATPIFVARQLGKHQVGLVWNEVSRRYVDEEPKPLKVLIQDSLLVYVCVIIGDFIVDQLNPIIEENITNPMTSGGAPMVFTDNPPF